MKNNVFFRFRLPVAFNKYCNTCIVIVMVPWTFINNNDIKISLLLLLALLLFINIGSIICSSIISKCTSWLKNKTIILLQRIIFTSLCYLLISRFITTADASHWRLLSALHVVSLMVIKGWLSDWLLKVKITGSYGNRMVKHLLTSDNNLRSRNIRNLILPFRFTSSIFIYRAKLTDLRTIFMILGRVG